MAKRRFRGQEPAPVEDLTPEQRRERRRRDRELIKKGKKPPTGGASQRRRILLLSVVAIVIVAVILLITFGGFFKPPCITFQPIPESSGLPAFPPHNTTDFSTTWCPSGVALEMHVHPYLQINIEGQSVGIPPTSSQAVNPPAIGSNSSYPGGYTCDLPIHTHPPDALAGYPDGVLHIESPWPYIYNLSTFFYVWQQSFSSVYVNTSHPSQPIVYQPNDLLGFTADANHKVELFVDGQASTAGPGLELNTLDYAASPYPSCLEAAYGTGHVIVLEYVSISPAVLGSGLHPATLATAGPNPAPYLASLGGPLEKVGDGPAVSSDRAHAELAALPWLTLRPTGA